MNLTGFAYVKKSFILNLKLNKMRKKLLSIAVFIGKFTTPVDCIQNAQTDTQNELVVVGVSVGNIFTVAIATAAAVVVAHFTCMKLHRKLFGA